MRKLLLFVPCFLFAILLNAQNQPTENEKKDYKEKVSVYRDSVDQVFADSATSILTEKDREVFSGLSYFVPNDTFRVKATFKKKFFKKRFRMATSTARRPLYRKYGVLSFEMNGVDCKLVVYQNMELRKKEKFKDYLFVPFKDLTNSHGSYGGGRYLDITIPDLKSDPIIDFNYCYNPYCAYNYKYSCPIPPKENNLQVAIRAGVKVMEHE